MSIAKNLESLQAALQANGATLVAVSKTKSIPEIQEAYDAGQRIFGENNAQELVEKQEALPKDIEWHLIGHLQSNKVKIIAPFVDCIQSVDSMKLLKEINKHAKKHKRVIKCLLQVFIAEETTKFGMDHIELIDLLRDEELSSLTHIKIVGLMGIATNTDKEKEIKEEFYELKMLFDGIKASYFRKDADFSVLSMGMSSDYEVALTQGSTMVRIGSTLFGKRVVKHVKIKDAYADDTES